MYSMDKYSTSYAGPASLPFPSFAGFSNFYPLFPLFFCKYGYFFLVPGTIQ